MIDDRPGLVLFWLADVSIRWAVLIGLLALWFAFRPPRRAATRHLLCAAVLAAGPALAITPRWGEAVIPWTTRSERAVVAEPISNAAPEPAPPSIDELSTLLATKREPRDSSERRAGPSSSPIQAVAAPRPVDWTGLAAKAAVGLWLAGALAILARLAFGAWTLARWTRGAVEPTAEDLAVLDGCLAVLPTRRPVRLARHQAVSSPVVIGGVRPTILVPTDWDAWPPTHRRAGLLHELAHIRRFDDAFKLAQELLRAPSWFHPFVLWLLARIDRERELLCDEAAVALGDDPKGLARLLLELSRPASSRRIASVSLPFLDRRTTAIRIERLLEDDMSRTLSRPSHVRTLMLGPLALCAALGVGGLRVRTATAQSPKPPEPTPAARSTASPAPTLRIVDSEGRPIAGATVTPWFPRSDDDRLTPTTSDAEGRSVLANTEASKPLYVFVWKPGFSPVWTEISRVARQPDGERRMTLDRAEPFTAFLVDERGEPIAGARLRLSQLITIPPFSSSVEARLVGFPKEIPGQTPPVPSLTTTTAEDGSFSFPHAVVGKTTAVKLKVETADGRILVVAPEASGTAPGEELQPGFVVVAADAGPKLKTVPAARITGRVLSKVPGVEISRLSVRTEAVRPYPKPIQLVAGPSAEVDRDGRFSLDGLAPGRINLSLHGPDRDKTWTFSRLTNVSLIPGETSEATLEVVPGVEVDGYVFARQTGRPASGVRVVATSPSRDDFAGEVVLQTNAEGRFHLRYPPGEIQLQLADSEAGFITPRNGLSIRAATIPGGVERFELPPFEVEATVAARVRVLDADRKPVAGAKVSLRRDPRNGPLDSSGVTDDQGVLNRDRRDGAVILHERARIHVTPPGGELQKFDVAPAADGLIEIVLPDFRVARDDAPKPLTSQTHGLFIDHDGLTEIISPDRGVVRDEASKALRGMVVDPDGKPLPGADVAIEDARPDAGAEPARWSLTSDADGRFAWTAPDGIGPVRISVSMSGLAPRSMSLEAPWAVALAQDLRFSLGKLGTFGGVLVDGEGKPLAGARVRATLRLASMPTGGGGDVNFSVFSHVAQSSDLGATRDATTAEDGSFTLPGDIPSATYEVKLEAFAADGRGLSVRRLEPSSAAEVQDATRVLRSGFHTLKPGERPTLTALPPARIEGRVVSQIPGFDLATLTARIPRGHFESPTEAPVDREGRFLLDGLDESPIDVVLAGQGLSESWTSLPARVASPTPGATVPVTLKVISGVEVRGRIVARGSEEPAGGVEIEVFQSPVLSTGEPPRTVVGGDGRYTLRLPPGETTIAVSHPGEHYVALQADGNTAITRRVGGFVQPVLTTSASTFAIPEGAAMFDAPPIEVAPAVTLHGRLASADGKPIVGAVLAVLTDRPYRIHPASPGADTARSDDGGAFRFRPGPGTVEAGRNAELMILGPGLKPRNLTVKPDADGFVEVIAPEPPARQPIASPSGSVIILTPEVGPAS